MRTHTQAFKEGIKQYGRQFNDIVDFIDGNTIIRITQDKINRVNYSVDTTLMKSVMQQVVVDINRDIDIDTYSKLNYSIQLDGVSNSYMYFSKFNVVKKEEKKDTKSYVYTCYDNMIKAMVDYESLGVTYPITIRDYLIAICSHLGLTFKNASDTFTNYNKQVTSEHYIDSDGNKMGYTFRDVLDDIAEAVGGFICIDNLGQLEIRYINNATSSKNLLGYTSRETSQGVTTTYDNSDGALILNGSATTTWVDLTSMTSTSLNAGTYTFSTKTSKNYNIRLRVKFQDNTTGNYTISKNDLKKTFTTTKKIIEQRVYIYEDNTLSGTLFENEKLFLQLEEGEEKTDFEPYVDTINEDYFNDKNVNIGKQITYNTLVLSRGDDSDNIYRPTTLPQEPKEFKISGNPILEQDNRENFIDSIYNNINGLSFYTNDFATTGILYYEIGDKYNVSIDGVIYPCLMLSDNIKRTTGLKENIVTNEPKQSVTDYKYSSTTDKVEISSRNAKILVDKANGRIDQIVEAVGDDGEVTTASIVQSINDSGSSIKLNADKVYINGVTFDNNQVMTMTKGEIHIEQIPGGLGLNTWYNDETNNTIVGSEVDPTGFIADERNATTNEVIKQGIYLNDQINITEIATNNIYNLFAQANGGITLILYDNNYNELRKLRLDSAGIFLNNGSTQVFSVTTGTGGDTTIKGTLYGNDSSRNGKNVSRLLDNTYVGTGVDLNNYKQAGQYGLYGNNTNAPTSDIGVLEVIEYSPDWIIQRFTNISYLQNTKTWQRTFHSGNTWTYWKMELDNISQEFSYSNTNIKVGGIYFKKKGQTVMFDCNGDLISGYSLPYGGTLYVSGIDWRLWPPATMRFPLWNLQGYYFIEITTDGKVYLYNYEQTSLTGPYNFASNGCYFSYNDW